MSNYRRHYVPGATYAFTVALANRKDDSLITHIERLREAFARIKREQPFEIIAICVLPDHLHTVWTLPPEDSDFSTRWMKIKRYVSTAVQVTANRSESKAKKREKGFWQRRFWEHQIRDEEELERCVDYIHFNPVKHGLVRKTVDWPHSSFHRFVERG
jgi:putative transposase